MGAKTDDPISKALSALLAELASAPLDLSAVARLSDHDVASQLEAWHRLRAGADGAIVQLQGEANRRQLFRGDGASNSKDWQVARFGVAGASARTYDTLGEEAFDLPHLSGALSRGEISLDKMRRLGAVATPETDAAYAAEARRSSVHELDQMLRARRRPSAGRDRAAHEARSLRFNDEVRTMTLQLPPAEYVETKACIESQAKALPSDGETPWDQRCCDAFLGLLRSAGHLAAGGAGARGRRGPAGDAKTSAGRGGSGHEAETATAEGPVPPSPFFAVLHAPLSALFDEAGSPFELAGDLEAGGLISLETVRRLLCDATFVVALDDDAGHTMYEGRQRRSPTGAQRREIWRRDRACRYPGCAHVLFSEPHHLEWWSKGGRTDLPNLTLLCQYHHHLMHTNGWSVSGNANEVLRFVGPDGRAMESRPSPLWTAMTPPAAPAPAARHPEAPS